MANMHQLLKSMIEQGASDLHISTGTTPQIRIDGKMTPTSGANMSSAETKQLCYSVLTDAQKRKFEEENELDLSFGVKGLSRFRGNIFIQRGAVSGAFRAIPFEIKSFAASCKGIVEKTTWTGFGNWANREWQDNDSCGHY